MANEIQQIEEARAFATLMELNDWDDRQLAVHFDVSHTHVRRALDLLDRPHPVPERGVSEAGVQGHARLVERALIAAATLIAAVSAILTCIFAR